MGLFGFLGRAIVNARRAVCRAVGAAIEKVGEVTHITGLEMAGIEIQINNPYLEKRVDMSTASVEETIDVHKMCEQTRTDVARQASKYEDEAICSLRNDIGTFIGVLAEVLPQEELTELGYGIDDSFEDDIRGTVSDYVATHISLDSEEFVKILNVRDSERKEKTADYSKKVADEAKEAFRKKCVSKKVEIYQKMLDDMKEYFSNEKKLAEEAQQNLEAMQKHQNNIGFREDQAVKTIVDIACVECIRTLTYGST